MTVWGWDFRTLDPRELFGGDLVDKQHENLIFTGDKFHGLNTIPETHNLCIPSKTINNKNTLCKRR